MYYHTYTSGDTHQFCAQCAPLPLPLIVIPHFLLEFGGDDGDGKTHDVRATHTSDAMDVVFRFVGQRGVDDER